MRTPHPALFFFSSAVGDNLKKTRLHVGFGTTVFMLGLICFATHMIPQCKDTKIAHIITFVLYLIFMIGTYATAIQFKNYAEVELISGRGVLTIAGFWAMAWFLATVAALVEMAGKCGDDKRWTFRSLFLCFYGFWVLPVFYALTGDTVGDKVGDAFAVLFLLMFVIATGEFCWKANAGGDGGGGGGGGAMAGGV